MVAVGAGGEGGNKFVVLFGEDQIFRRGAGGEEGVQGQVARVILHLRILRAEEEMGVVHDLPVGGGEESGKALFQGGGLSGIRGRGGRNDDVKFWLWGFALLRFHMIAAVVDAQFHTRKRRDDLLGGDPVRRIFTVVVVKVGAETVGCEVIVVRAVMIPEGGADIVPTDGFGKGGRVRDLRPVRIQAVRFLAGAVGIIKCEHQGAASLGNHGVSRGIRSAAH